jgi:kumamolisin
MPPSESRVVLKGTAPPERPASRAARTDEIGTVDVYLRRREPLDEIRSYGRTRPHLHLAELRDRHGARAEDLALVCAFAAEHGLRVTGVDLATRRIRVTGPWATLGAAFGTTINVVAIDGREVFSNAGEISLPASVAPAVEHVLGLDTTPVVRPHGGGYSSGANNLTVAAVASHYGFPTETPGGAACNGAGETVALLEFGANFDLSSFQSTLTSLGLPVPTCDVRTDLLAGANPGDTWDGEAMLDALIVAQAAPGAKIVVWLSTGFTAANIQAAIGAATTDATEPATILSMSYGGWYGWSSAQLGGIDSAFQDAAALGVTCINSSGDSGGTPTPVQSPADSPNVLAVGGTVIEANGTEVVWNNGTMASTGGYSPNFSAPSWQVASLPTGTTGRGVPDVAAHADSYGWLGGVWLGTSAAAPLWAAFVARINQLRIAAGGARSGLVAPDLYANAASLTDVTSGNNGVGTAVGYAATAGWDPATGLGSPSAATAPALMPIVAWVSPAANASLKGSVELVAGAQGVAGVEFSASYATDPSNVSTVAWHVLGNATAQASGKWSLTIDTSSIPNQGNAGWGTVNLCALVLDAQGTPGLLSQRAYRLVTVANPVLRTMVAAVSTPALPLPAGKSVLFKVHATDTVTRDTVAGTVYVGGASKGATDSAITYTFVAAAKVTGSVSTTTHTVAKNPLGHPEVITTTKTVTTTHHSYPPCTVSAVGYADATVNLGLSDYDTTATTTTSSTTT